jgi:nitrogen fixation/metabolism regulation signal transduction histidine kinase
MNLENLLLVLGVVLSLLILGAAIAFLLGNHTLRARLVAVFLALAIVPALLTMVTLWRELQALRDATPGTIVSEHGLLLAQTVLADHHGTARRAADAAVARLIQEGAPKPEQLDGLLARPYVALLCAGAPGTEEVLALRGDWDAEPAQAFVRDLLPGSRSGSERARMVQAPDGSSVVVGVAGPADLDAQPHFAIVVLALPVPEAEAIASVVESHMRSLQIGLYERLHIRNAGLFLAATAILFLFLAPALGVFLAHTLTRPIERLQMGFEAVAAGDLGHQIEARSTGELGRLTDAFNTMSRDLHESNERLVRATRLAAWQDVARRLAHEIKNPLTPITLSIHRVRKRPGAEDPVVSECLDTILEETSHLLRLADEFSAFARMPKPRLEKIDPGEVLQQVLELYSALPNFRVHAELDGVPAVLADRDQIRQVFTNLAKNAVEAMPQGGELEVSWARDAGSIAFTFADRGCGFPSKAGERVFEPTYTTKPSGSGLGLAIVRRILEDHGGDIQAGNRRDGGAWVQVRLPAAQ